MKHVTICGPRKARPHTAATLTMACAGPEVKGSAAYLEPEIVKWSVGLYYDGRIWVTASVTGLGRNGQPAPGSANFSEGGEHWQTPIPEWLERPDEWIEKAADLARLADERYGPGPSHGA